jgi:hypothetical protein
LQTSLSVIASADDHGWLFSPHECIALAHLLWKKADREPEVSTTSDYTKSTRFAKGNHLAGTKHRQDFLGRCFSSSQGDYTEGETTLKAYR